MTYWCIDKTYFSFDTSLSVWLIHAYGLEERGYTKLAKLAKGYRYLI